VTNFNEFTEFESGYYYFDEETYVMNVEETVIDGYYYADGGKSNKSSTAKGLVLVDGYYYCVMEKGNVMTGRYAVTKPNDLKEKGIYYFDAEGKMLFDVVVDGFYYTADGISESYLGLVRAADGNIYCVIEQGKVVRNNASYFVSKTNGLVAKKGRYAFGENGALVL
jgi:hypothetical protein